MSGGKKYPVIGILLVLLNLQTFAQLPYLTTDCPRSRKQAHVWYFGDYAGIDFRSGNAVALTNQDSMVAFKTSGVISDSLGNLLFITNGKSVWDRSFAMMPNATGLYGDKGVSQPCIVVPKPGNPDIFYIFTVDVIAFKQDNTYTTKGLCFSVVDMTRRGGMGDATDELNVSLLNPATQKLTAVMHRNGRDIWVIAHKWDSDEFYAWLVRTGSVSEPVISKSGSVHGGGYLEQTNAYGCMKASPDGSRLAFAISGLNTVESFSFNNETGTVSGALSYTFAQPNICPYGIEFSPDSKKLYTSLMQIYGNGPPTRPSLICQFDLVSGLINPIIIDSVPGLRVSTMQLAPDGRIYIARTVNLITKDDSLDVIYNPTRAGTECNFNRVGNIAKSGFALMGRNGLYSLPNIVQTYVNIPVFTWDSCCYQDVTRFHITNRINIDSVRWDFGDGGSSTDFEPVHLYLKPGSYYASLTEYFNGIPFIDSLIVTVHPKPEVDLGDTVLLYTGSSINLNAGEGFMEYLWSTNSTGPVITVEDQGDYWVKVKDYFCCVNSDSVYVRVFDYYTPNAFTPNGDGLNDYFRVIGMYRNIDFRMFIYDRWGRIVFQSDDIDTGWDGKTGGQPCPADVYVWTFQVKFRGEDIITKGDVVFKGSVTLLR